MTKQIIITLLFYLMLFSSVNAEISVKEVLPGGTTVITQNINSSEIASFTILIKLGVYDEESYAQGIRAFLTELIKEKIKNEKTEQGTSLIELRGVSANTNTEPDYISFTFVCKSGDLPEILNITLKAIANPTGDKTVYDSAKLKYKEKYKDINGIIDNIYSLFLASFYSYHPYKYINQYSLSTIDRMSIEKLADFTQKTFSQDRITVSLSGNFNRDKAIDIIKTNFESLDVAQKKNNAQIQWEPRSSEKQMFLSALSNRSWLLIGYSFPSYSSPDYPELLIAKEIIGEGFNSKFWIELREKNGYAYELGAIAPPLSGPAHVMFYVILQTKNVLNARKIAYEIIENIKREGVTDKELAIAKEKILGSLLLKRESTANFSLDTAVSEAIGENYKVEMNLRKDVLQVTKEDVKRGVNKYFKDPVIIIVRPPGLYIKDTYL